MSCIFQRQVNIQMLHHPLLLWEITQIWENLQLFNLFGCKGFGEKNVKNDAGSEGKLE